MYKFVDTTTEGTSSLPLSLQTIFNSVNLDKELTDENGSFITIAVSGRGPLRKWINAIRTSGQHGQREKSYAYDIREIRVTFKLQDETSEGFRERFNQLNYIVSQAKQRIEFTDEEAYYIATLELCDMPDEDSNNIVGTLMFICSDPAKYKASRSLSVTTSYANHTAIGHAPMAWTSLTVFSSATNRYTIENDKGGKITLNHAFGVGDRLEIDYEKRLIKLNGVARMALLSLDSRWFMLQAGVNRLRASHATTVGYTETYY